MLLLHYGIDPERDIKMLPLGDHKTLYEALKLLGVSMLRPSIRRFRCF